MSEDIDEPSDKISARSRSIFKQFQQSFGAIQRNRSRPSNNTESSSTVINNKRSSSDNFEHEKTSSIKRPTRSTTPGTFSHRMSFLHHVKSHLNRSKKSSTNDQDDFTHLSFTTPTTESKSSTIVADNPLITTTAAVDILVDPSMENDENQLLTNEASFDSGNVEDRNSQSFSINVENKRHSALRLSQNKNKVQSTESTNRQLFNRSPSLTSVLTNISLPELIYWVEIHIDRGRDLSIKDFNGTSDPYVKVYYGSTEKYTSSTIFKSLNPIWNEKFHFFAPDLNIPVQFQLFDYDRIGRDEAMGTAQLDLFKLPLDTIYSATLDLENEKRTDGKTGMIQINVLIMSKTSEFRDEILRSMSKGNTTKSSFNTRSTLTPVFARRTVDVFIIEGRNLSGNRIPNPFVRLKFGAHKKYRTQTMKSTNNPKWHQSFMYDVFVNELPPLELSVIDDTGGSGEFIARAICNLTHLDEERTHKISVDLEDNAGVIDLFVTITGTTPSQEATNDGETSNNPVLDQLPSKLTDEDLDHYNFISSLKSLVPINDVGKVEIKIYQARDLSAKDINGKSDPFCVVELDSTRLRTHTIYKTLDPVWNKSFVIPIQDIHSVVELTIFDEDMNKSPEFIGKVAIPLLAIRNGERKWLTLKDRKCVLPVKGIIEIEANLIYTNVKAVLRTFNPRQVRYYQADGKIRVAVFKQHINRARTMLMNVVNLVKFIDYCFQWENPLLSFSAFMISLIIVWNFQLYMLPCGLLLLFGRNAVIEYRRGRLGTAFSTLGDETVSAVIQPVNIDEDILDADGNSKEQKKSFLSVIHGVQETVLEVQGYVDVFASTLERIKNLFNFTVPWLSILAIVVLTFVSIVLYFIPLRYLILAFIINKFTKRFRKPKGYIDNNELADFISRLPSDPELLQYREVRFLSRVPSPKKAKRVTSNGK